MFEYVRLIIDTLRKLDTISALSKNEIRTEQTDNLLISILLVSSRKGLIKSNGSRMICNILRMVQNRDVKYVIKCLTKNQMQTEEYANQY